MGTTIEETVGSRSGVRAHFIIETSTDGTTWEQTDWDEAVADWGQIRKRIENWQGLWETGALGLTLKDPDNIIYGSFTH